MRRIADNQISAVVVVPKDFTRDYLSARRPVTLELIKKTRPNRFYPAIVEKLLRALTTTLNAVHRNFRPELAGWQALLERTNPPSPREITGLVAQTADRIEALRDFLFPPLVQYGKAAPGQGDEGTAVQSPPGKPDPNPVSGIFWFILPGMAAMFLLFIADNAVRDLYREQRFRTFQRYCTLPPRLFAYVGAKVVFAVAILLISSLKFSSVAVR